MFSAREILSHTGGHCPAHHDKKSSLSVTERNGKVLVHCFAGCSQRDVLAALRRRGLSIPKNKYCASRPFEKENSQGEVARALWERSVPLRGTLGDYYLHEHRRIDVGPSRDALRFLPYARVGLMVPALIAALHDQQGELTAVQLTYLDRETGKKIALGRRRLEKQTFGAQRGGAVQLIAIHEEDKTLGVAEGIETALSAFELYGVPTWAALGAGRLGCVQAPEGIRHMRIFADNDAAGMEAARRAGGRYKSHGFEVSIFRPEHQDDFNDLLRDMKT